MIDITPILEALITLVVAVIGVLGVALVAWLRRKLSTEQLAILTTIVQTAVMAAEQLKDAGVIKPEERKAQALQDIYDALGRVGLTFDTAAIDRALEAAVLELNLNQQAVGA